MENLPTPPIQLINDEEKDTESSEDLNPQQVQELLYPNGHFPITLPQFAVAVSSVLLKGWVKQPSPSCAAASVGTLRVNVTKKIVTREFSGGVECNKWIFTRGSRRGSYE